MNWPMCERIFTPPVALALRICRTGVARLSLGIGVADRGQPAVAVLAREHPPLVPIDGYDPLVDIAGQVRHALRADAHLRPVPALDDSPADANRAPHKVAVVLDHLDTRVSRSRRDTRRFRTA